MYIAIGNWDYLKRESTAINAQKFWLVDAAHPTKLSVETLQVNVSTGDFSTLISVTFIYI
ncbi:hypothetical protein H6G50_02905 [Oscillatoria sp. FACHB-1406]|nr:hypothetical protein [Oscillatoria sp. FACHB-1406]